jgi:hypothetical protein
MNQVGKEIAKGECEHSAHANHPPGHAHAARMLASKLVYGRTGVAIA